MTKNVIIEEINEMNANEKEKTTTQTLTVDNWDCVQGSRSIYDFLFLISTLGSEKSLWHTFAAQHTLKDLIISNTLTQNTHFADYIVCIYKMKKKESVDFALACHAWWFDNVYMCLVCMCVRLCVIYGICDYVRRLCNIIWCALRPFHQSVCMCQCVEIFRAAHMCVWISILCGLEIARFIFIQFSQICCFGAAAIDSLLVQCTLLLTFAESS